jgi:hypothetical protein
MSDLTEAQKQANSDVTEVGQNLNPYSWEFQKTQWDEYNLQYRVAVNNLPFDIRELDDE